MSTLVFIYYSLKNWLYKYRRKSQTNYTLSITRVLHLLPLESQLQMLHFHHCLSLHTNLLNNPSIFFFLTHPNISVSRRWDLFNKNKRRRRRRNFPLVKGVEKDSEFEIDPDKAREALRKLDEQLQTLSQKQIDPPKIRGNSVSLSL